MSNKFIHNGEFIWSYPTLRNNSKKWFIYKCSQCGTLEEKQFRNLDHSLLCHKCKLHLTISNRNGKYHTSKHIKQFIPKKHYISKFPNRRSPLFSTRQIFIYRCDICNKIVESSSKFLQYENRKTLLCQKCRLRESYQLNGTTLDTIKQKRESTMISRYGAKCTSQCDVLKDKALNTNLIKYGSTCNLHGRNSPSRNPLLSHKYLYNDIYFDSSWELAFYVYFKDHAVHIEREPIYFEYTFNKKIHKYYPDFKLPCGYIEIKGDFLFNKLLVENTQDNAKYNCILKNNIQILRYKEIKYYIYYLKLKHPSLLDECLLR